MSQIENFHAHVYNDVPDRAQALALCDAAGEKFGIKVGRMHDNPVGPHPRGGCQLTTARINSPMMSSPGWCSTGAV